MTNYEIGFVEKCAEFGISPIELVKHAAPMNARVFDIVNKLKNGIQTTASDLDFISRVAETASRGSSRQLKQVSELAARGVKNYNNTAAAYNGPIGDVIKEWYKVLPFNESVARKALKKDFIAQALRQIKLRVMPDTPKWLQKSKIGRPEEVALQMAGDSTKNTKKHLYAAALMDPESSSMVHKLMRGRKFEGAEKLERQIRKDIPRSVSEALEEIKRLS